MSPLRRAGRTRLAAAVTAGVVVLGPAASLVHGQAGVQGLQQQIGKTSSRQQDLRKGVAGDDAQIATYQGRADDLRDRLNALQMSVDTQKALLTSLQTRLRSARARGVRLRVRLAHDRQVLADQLVSSYESTPPSLVDVVVRASSWADLVEEADREQRISDANVKAATAVRAARTQVRGQARRFAVLEAQQERVTRAVLVERDQIVELRLVLLGKAQVFRNSRARRQMQLHTLDAQRDRLQHRLDALQAPTATAASVAGLPVAHGAFSEHGGDYGFFQSPGTNYAVGDEPELASRLDALGKALHLHLIGISGYRTPAHSIEVGGFANDPHTRGQASDTPGVEGVPEATLNHFGLTRPFGAASEADHIQLMGSSTAL